MNDAATSIGIAEEIGSRWKPYPVYKDSGIEWLGEMPAHWDSEPLKYTVRFINGAPFKPTDWGYEGVPIIRIENLNKGTEFNFTNIEVDPKYHVQSGDLLFAWSGNRGTSFGPFLWEREGLHYLNQHIFRLANFTCDKEWFYWALKGVTAYVEKQAHGIIGLVHITKSELGIIRIPKLSQDEQHTIASFLDRETSHIDTLIAKKERLIEFLTEKRSALISHAVTKGLDPTVPMKDSGVEWIGEIPTHWNVKRNKAIFREHNLRSVSGEEELLTVSHITGVTRRSEKTVTMIEAESHEDYKLCKEGDLVINTMWCWMGALGIAWEAGMVSPSYNVYRPIESNLCARYFDYLCRIPVYVSELTRYSKGVWKSRLRLYPEEFLRICTPLPDLVAQRTIASFLDRETAQINALVSKVRAHIETLKEYRTALISAAVTGKIDIRSEVA